MSLGFTCPKSEGNYGTWYQWSVNKCLDTSDRKNLVWVTGDSYPVFALNILIKNKGTLLYLLYNRMYLLFNEIMCQYFLLFDPFKRRIFSQPGKIGTGKKIKSLFFLLGLKYTLRTCFESKNFSSNSCPELSNQQLSFSACQVY